MPMLSAKNIRTALKKAQGVGLVEESFTIGGCEVTMRSLRPGEVDAALAESEGLDNNLAYLHTYQLANISRALVEVDGTDFRDVDFIEDEIDDPKNPGKTKTVKIETHEWLKKNVLVSWGQEVLSIAFRKHLEISEAAEKKANEGITFKAPDEKPEDKYRRLLHEAHEIEDELPQKLMLSILDEQGWIPKSTLEEAKRATERLTKIVPEETTQHVPMQEAPVAVQEAPVAAPPPEPVRKRQPLNQTPAALPEPPKISPEVLKRAEQIANLEANADHAGVLPSDIGAPRREAQVLAERRTPTDPKAATTVIDAPARGGLNPHYRPPSKT